MDLLGFKKSWAVIGNIILKLIIPFILLIVFLCVMVAGTVMLTAGDKSLATILSIVGTIGYLVTLIYMALKALYYSLSMYILKDNEKLTGKEIVEKSAELMKGNRWNYVWLSITFIGWAILAACTLGIGMLWLAPYMQVAQIVFYEDKAGLLNKAEETKQVETEVVEEQ